MKKVLQFSEGQLQRELFACIKQLLAAGDENSIMRSFLYQTCLLQGATGGLIGMNPSLATQPGGGRSGFRVQSVGIIGNEIVDHQLRERTDVDVEGWDILVSVVTKLGWSPSQPRFSKAFGTVGDQDFCQFFGYAVRSNFGDVLGFVIYTTSQSDPFAIADSNTTLVSQLYLFRLLELLSIRQCAFRKTDSGYEFYETTGSMFPAIDDVYSRSIHDLNGVLATISMQSQMIAHEFLEGEKVNTRAQKIYALLEQAEIYMNRSESMTRIFNGKIDSLELSDMVDLASATGAIRPISEIAILADSPAVVLPDSAIEKLILYFLCHNVIRLLTIRTQTSAGRSDYDIEKVKLVFAIDILSQFITVTGTLPADPEVNLNTDMARKDHDYQLGRRVNAPRRILEQVLSKIGGTLMWETRDAVTYLVMRVPMRFTQITN
jgi:hypothetical protein